MTIDEDPVHIAVQRHRATERELVDLVGEYLTANLGVEVAATSSEPGSAVGFLTMEARRSVAAIALVRYLGDKVKPIIVEPQLVGGGHG